MVIPSDTSSATSTTSAERPTSLRQADADANDTVETKIRTGQSDRKDARLEHNAGADVLEPGMHVGQYLIEQAHSKGGFATVYRAVHEKIGRTVAIKVLHAQLANTPNIVKRFEQEARAVNRISHPNIVDITDYGELADGRPFFVMEWLCGSTLKQFVRDRGALSQEDVLRICEDIIPAIAAAHEHGIIHRDLKLSNVIGVPKGDWFHFKLLDFGIAKVIHPDGLTDGLMTTEQGNRVGSPLSMAPEQIRCQPVDGRTDIYALGVMLFELVTGKAPYRGATAMEVEKLHLRAPVPTATEFAPVSVTVSTVISRCMQKAKDDRQASMDNVLAELRRAITGDGRDDTTRRQLGAVAPTSVAGAPQGRGKWFALAGVVAVAMVATVAIAFSGDDEPTTTKPTKPTQPTQQVAPPAQIDAGTTARVQPAKTAPVPHPVKAHRGSVTQLVGTFKPATFDVSVSLATAQKIAREHFGDAELTKIEADNVTSDGMANLVVGKTAIVMYQFRSPSAKAADGGNDSFCLYYVYADKARYYHYPVRSHDCAVTLIGPPKCTAAQVWQRARKRGVPEDLKVAKLRYTSARSSNKKNKAQWIFSAGTKVELKLPDNCQK